MAEDIGNAFGKSSQAYRLEDIDEMEKASVERANKAISAIENAMAVWEASPEKPEELKPRIIRLKYFYEEILGWEKKALQTMGRRDAIGARVERLKEFTEICFRYA